MIHESANDSELFKRMNLKLNEILSKVNFYKCKIHPSDTLSMNHIREQHLELKYDRV